jgi:carbonic anhydrase
MFCRQKILLASVILFSSLSFAKETKPSVEPGEALRMIKNGNIRFTKGLLRKDGQAKSDITRLSTGQQPHTIVLSCSDSRVPPELVFDQKLGELFVVRTAGQSLDDNAIGSIEYAIEHLGAKLIVVMGHTSCGAVKAAHGTLDGSSAGSPAIDALVKEIHPRIAKFKSQKPSNNFESESWANVDGIIVDLMAKSKIISHELNTGKLWITPALYTLDSGSVTFHEPVMKSAKH